MLSWNCPCCAPFDFDPVDLPSRASHRPKRQLRSQACAASPVVENLQKNSTKKASQQRNVVAVGLQRFAEGALQPQPDWEQLTDRVGLCFGTESWYIYTQRDQLLSCWDWPQTLVSGHWGATLRGRCFYGHLGHLHGSSWCGWLGWHYHYPHAP